MPPISRHAIPAIFCRTDSTMTSSGAETPFVSGLVRFEVAPSGRASLVCVRKYWLWGPTHDSRWCLGRDSAQTSSAAQRLPPDGRGRVRRCPGFPARRGVVHSDWRSARPPLQRVAAAFFRGVSLRRSSAWCCKPAACADLASASAAATRARAAVSSARASRRHSLMSVTVECAGKG